MSKDVSFSTFPSDKYSALALLYTQNQDLSGLSAEEIVDLYDDAYQSIRRHSNDKKPSFFGGATGVGKV